jgi:two-component system cell cycle response regulator
VVLSGPQFGEVFRLVPGREHVVGRREGADVALIDDGVSRRHARLTVDARGAWLSDLGSQNGTWVEGRAVQETRLTDGGRFQVGGHTTLKFVHADELEASYQLRLAESALHDPLTGLHNRRHLDERLLAELSAAQRHGRPLSVLMADLDHFKQVNDQHGHLVGDEALKLAALVLRGALRKEDSLARYGGEEFVVVARETGAAGARALGERLRRAVASSRCSAGGVEVALTVSVGVATAPDLRPGPPAGIDQALLDLADKALYRAKLAGRNRVEAAIFTMAPGPPFGAGGGPGPGPAQGGTA